MSEGEPESEKENEAETKTYPCFCTYACTGKQKAYQAIFVCRTCCSSSDELFCVCEACANHCHEAEFHDEVEYLGKGYGYCDCMQIGRCKLIEESKRNVSEWKIPVGSGQCSLPVVSGNEDDPPQFVMDCYSIPELYEKETECKQLVEAASLLIKDSKETFWLSNDQDKDSWCCLEKIAWRIFEQNKALYDLDIQENGGGEWWVQVKKNFTSADDPAQGASGSEAVDVHYDKDEELAEKYGLGSFPVLSTVTYLTDGMTSNPTIILGRTYEQPDDEIIPDMLVSHPVLGKHLVFDGRLLHGAPNAELHKRYIPSDEKKQRALPDVRVTLLVNIWADRKPAGVDPLGPSIRNRINSKIPQTSVEEQIVGELKFEKQTIEDVVLKEEEEETLERIELLFVCKGITWENEDDESGGLVVVTCPPPDHTSDSVYVKFGPGVQAYLDSAQGDIDQDIRNSHDLAYEEDYI